MNPWQLASAKHSAPKPDRGRYKINRQLKIAFCAAIAFCVGTCVMGAKVLAGETEKSPPAAATLSSNQHSAAVVALASSFRAVWPALMEAYALTKTEPKPKASFASSGLLGTQIRHGAPFELFLSADVKTVALLHSLGKSVDEGVALAQGSLSLIAPADSAAEPAASVFRQILMPESADKNNIASAVANAGTVTGTDKALKLAIPNPRHAPYGIAAQQLLSNTGLWPWPKGQLLNAENAAQALQYALNGAVDYALVPSTLLSQSHYTLQLWPVDLKHYDAITHQMVLLNNSGPAARTLYSWLQGKEAAGILLEAGLLPAY